MANLTYAERCRSCGYSTCLVTANVAGAPAEIPVTCPCGAPLRLMAEHHALSRSAFDEAVIRTLRRRAEVHSRRDMADVRTLQAAADVLELPC